MRKYYIVAHSLHVWQGAVCRIAVISALFHAHQNSEHGNYNKNKSRIQPPVLFVRIEMSIMQFYSGLII